MAKMSLKMQPWEAPAGSTSDRHVHYKSLLRTTGEECIFFVRFVSCSMKIRPRQDPCRPNVLKSKTIFMGAFV